MNLKNRSFYIYGSGYSGRALQSALLEDGLEPAAFLDSYAPLIAIEGVDISRPDASGIIKEYPVLVSILGYPDICDDLQNLGYVDVVKTETVLKRFPRALTCLATDGQNWRQLNQDVEFQESEIERLKEVLSDQESLDDLEKVLAFRRAPSLATYPWPHSYEMYFPPNLYHRYTAQPIRLLDLGAFTGDSFEAFHRYCGPHFEAYSAVELSTENIAQLEKTLKHRSHGVSTEIHHGAVGVEPGSLVSLTELGSASKVGDGAAGSASTQAIGLDLAQIVANFSPTVIKSDIEGADYPALLQITNYIRHCSPVLALSVYHTPRDLWRIPLLIEDTCPGRYDIYIRQEGHWGFETQLYMFPKEN